MFRYALLAEPQWTRPHEALVVLSARLSFAVLWEQEAGRGRGRPGAAMATLGLSKVFILDKYFTELQKFWETEKKLQGELAKTSQNTLNFSNNQPLFPILLKEPQTLTYYEVVYIYLKVLCRAMKLFCKNTFPLQVNCVLDVLNCTSTFLNKSNYLI